MDMSEPTSFDKTTKQILLDFISVPPDLFVYNSEPYYLRIFTLTK